MIRTGAAALMLGISTAALYRLVKAGELPVARVEGRRKFFRFEDVRRLAARIESRNGRGHIKLRPAGQPYPPK